MSDSASDKAKPVGLTKDSGWQVGVRKTMSVDLEHGWQVLTSEPGLKIWLGEHVDLAEGDEFALPDGTRCQIRVFKPNSHLRMGWQPPSWKKASTIQLRVIGRGGKTVVAFHQENLPDQQSRVERRTFFKEALQSLAEEMDE